MTKTNVNVTGKQNDFDAKLGKKSGSFVSMGNIKRVGSFAQNGRSWTQTGTTSSSTQLAKSISNKRFVFGIDQNSNSCAENSQFADLKASSTSSSSSFESSQSPRPLMKEPSANSVSTGGAFYAAIAANR